MSNPDESLLVRWSRRKGEARQSVAAEPVAVAPTPAAPEAETEADANGQTAALSREDEASAGDQTGEPEIRVEDLPDIETLTYDSDFSVFMRKGVPELIKQQALRKLWGTDPILANLDGLNDYDPLSMTFLIQDMEGPVEPIAEVGRGMRDKIMERKRARDDRTRGPRRPRSGQDRQEHHRLEVEQAAKRDDKTAVENRPDDDKPDDPEAAANKFDA